MINSRSGRKGVWVAGRPLEISLQIWSSADQSQLTLALSHIYTFYYLFLSASELASAAQKGNSITDWLRHVCDTPGQPSLLLQDLLRLTPSPLTLFSANSKAHSAKSKLIYIFRAALSHWRPSPGRDAVCECVLRRNRLRDGVTDTHTHDAGKSADAFNALLRARCGNWKALS